MSKARAPSARPRVDLGEVPQHRGVLGVAEVEAVRERVRAGPDRVQVPGRLLDGPDPARRSGRPGTSRAGAATVTASPRQLSALGRRTAASPWEGDTTRPCSDLIDGPALDLVIVDPDHALARDRVGREDEFLEQLVGLGVRDRVRRSDAAGVRRLARAGGAGSGRPGSRRAGARRACRCTGASRTDPATTSPMSVAGTSWRRKISRRCRGRSGRTSRSIRSWDSEIQISHGGRPASRSGTGRGRSATRTRRRGRARPTRRRGRRPPRSLQPCTSSPSNASRQAWMSGSFMIGLPSWTAPRDSSSLRA